MYSTKKQKQNVHITCKRMCARMDFGLVECWAPACALDFTRLRDLNRCTLCTYLCILMVCILFSIPLVFANWINRFLFSCWILFVLVSTNTQPHTHILTSSLSVYFFVRNIFDVHKMQKSWSCAHFADKQAHIFFRCLCSLISAKAMQNEEKKNINNIKMHTHTNWH